MGSSEFVNLPLPSRPPRFYVNGFSGGLGAADVVLNFNVGPDPVLELRMSHAVARDLHSALHEILEQYETVTGQKVAGTRAVNEKLTASAQTKNTESA